jgi:hypothetical protein
MGRRRNIEPNLIEEYFRLWNDATRREDKAAIIAKAEARFGIKRVAIYNRFREMRNGLDRLIVAGYDPVKSVRKSEEELIRMKIEVVNIAAVKHGLKGDRKGYGASATRAIQIAEAQGLIRGGAWTRHSYEYWARYFGVSNRDMGDTQVATQLVADHSNQAWMIDSTPSNQYYFNFKRQYIIYRPEITKDKHLGDIMRKEGLWKIWTYVLRDVYSGAWFIMPFAPDGRGENLDDYLTFVIEAMTAKRDLRIPVHGIPEIIISDKGSSLTSNLWKAFFFRLGSEVRAHKARRPEAKGIVEGQISANKRSNEAPLPRELVHSMEELTAFYTEWMIYDNVQHGYYAKWLESAWRKPVTRCTEKNIRDAFTTEDTRVVSAYRTVSIDGEEWYTSSELQERERVTIFTNREGGKSCQRADGSVFPMRHIGRIQRHVKTYQILDDRGIELVKTDGDRTREDVYRIAAELRPGLSLHAFMPQNNNALPAIKPASVEISTHSDMPESLPDPEAFWSWIERSVGVTKDELGQYGIDIDYTTVQVYASNGMLPGEYLRRLRNHIIKSLQESGGELANGG